MQISEYQKSSEKVLFLLREEKFLGRKALTYEEISTVFYQKYDLDFSVMKIKSVLNAIDGKGYFKTSKTSEGRIAVEIMAPGTDLLTKRQATEFTTKCENFDFQHVHPRVKEASYRLFSDGHYPNAVFDAITEVEIMVKEKSGITGLIGKKLMSDAFNPASPKLRFNQTNTDKDKDEQEGFMHIYMGAMQGIKNIKSHAKVIQNDPYITFEYIQFASLLAKKIDKSIRTGTAPST